MIIYLLFLFFNKGLKDQIRKVCAEEYFVCGEGDEQGGAWQEKVKLLFLFLRNKIYEYQLNIVHMHQSINNQHLENYSEDKQMKL